LDIGHQAQAASKKGQLARRKKRKKLKGHRPTTMRKKEPPDGRKKTAGMDGRKDCTASYNYPFFGILSSLKYLSPYLVTNESKMGFHSHERGKGTRNL
jgi:hypothetical protein